MALFPYLVNSNQTITSTLSTHNGMQSSVALGWTVNAGFRQLITPIAMSVSNMHVNLTTAPGAGTSRTFTSRKNLTNDNLTVTISDTATSGSDTTNNTYLSAGDQIDIVNTWTGAPADAITQNQWAFMGNSANQVLFATSTAAISATGYLGVQSTSAISATRTDVEQAMPTSGTIRNLIAYLGTGTISSGSYVVTLYKNGSATSITTTLDSSNRQNTDSSNTVTFAEGDLLSWEVAYNAPSNNRTVLIGCEFVPDTPNEGILLTTAGATAITHAAKSYSGFYSVSNNFATSTRSAFALPMTIKKLYAQLGTAPGAGKSRTFTVDQNGSDALSLTISDTNTSGSVTGNAKIELGDQIAFSSIRLDGFTANSTLKLGLVFNATPSGMMMMF